MSTLSKFDISYKPTNLGPPTPYTDGKEEEEPANEHMRRAQPCVKAAVPKGIVRLESEAMVKEGRLYSIGNLCPARQGVARPEQRGLMGITVPMYTVGKQ